FSHDDEGTAVRWLALTPNAPRLPGSEVAMGRHVLVWDAPNVDMTLANIIDDKPTVRERPDMAVLANWLVARAGPGDDVEACVFVNVAPHVAGALSGWIQWLLEEGYRVFAKPKADSSDVDEDML